MGDTSDSVPSPPRGEGQGEGDRRWPGVSKDAKRAASAEQTSRARDLRRSSTPPEILLWSALRGNRIGLRFRRQEPIAGLTVDFVCHAARLVVEVDGAHHDLTWRSDAARDAKLRAAGFRVQRFAAADVTKNLEGVVTAIREAIGTAPPLSPTPSPRGGEGSRMGDTSSRVPSPPSGGGTGRGGGQTP
jgi:very-short-patch-repair endonuclease